jgi:hypothetical protein
MARHMSNLTCQFCGHDFTCSPRWAKTTKFCKLCQVIRDHQVVGRKMQDAKKCSQCSREFYPIRSAASWTKCGYCDMHPLENSQRCQTCWRVTKPAEGLESSCLGCVQSTPEKRTEYLTRIRNIVEERREEIFADAP